jgi:hypothetical protein
LPGIRDELFPQLKSRTALVAIVLRQRSERRWNTGAEANRIVFLTEASLLSQANETVWPGQGQSTVSDAVHGILSRFPAEHTAFLGRQILFSHRAIVDEGEFVVVADQVPFLTNLIAGLAQLTDDIDDFRVPKSFEMIGQYRRLKGKDGSSSSTTEK